MRSTWTRLFHLRWYNGAIDFTESIRSAQINHGVESSKCRKRFKRSGKLTINHRPVPCWWLIFSFNDLVWRRQNYAGSRWQWLYELITTSLPKRYFRHRGFGNDAWPIWGQKIFHTCRLDLTIQIRLRFRTCNGYFKKKKRMLNLLW